MHLDTVCTQIDYDKFTVYPGMYDELHAYRLRKGDNPGEIAVDELDGSLKEILEMATGVDEVTLIECGGETRRSVSRAMERRLQYAGHRTRQGVRLRA